MGESEKYMGEGRLCERCSRKCANAKKIEALRKRCEEFMRLVQAFVQAVNKD